MPIYRLAGPSVAALTGSSPHIPAADLANDACAACHVSHSGKSVMLSSTAGGQAALCYRCHTTGASFDVQADFTGRTANNPATGSYYSHPVADASTARHVLDSDDEFGGQSNRHAVCADCHQPHNATNAPTQQSTTGWTASGALAGASAIAVANGAAASVPTYQRIRLSAGTGGITYEYELCLKCHSGSTSLRTPEAGNPSWWALDKGVEMNPANTSYHPVEASGKNISRQMQGSLSGASPYKVWDLTVDSLVRCTQCHGNDRSVPVKETAHASANRGILIAPYRDRLLKPAGEAYASADFSLCFLCHTDAPFLTSEKDGGRTDTSFSLHGKHVRAIGGSNPSTSIDTPGAGNGNAICAECHFRIHSNALAFRQGDTEPVTRTTNGTSLVNFSPNVRGPSGFGTASWTPPNQSGIGSCTLYCHSRDHSTSMPYTVAPATGFIAAPTSGAKGLTGLVVQFADRTRYVNGTTATYGWDFGDGVTVSGVGLQNPSHTYTVAGTYSVTLTVTRPSGDLPTMSMTRTNYITVTP